MAPKSKATGRSKTQSHFTNIRDPFVADAANGASPSLLNMTTDSSGSFGFYATVAPFGIAGATSTTTTLGSLASFATYTSILPVLPWLYNTSRNFERYRITRATLVFVGNLGSTTSGKIMLDTSTDMADTFTSQSLSTGTGGKIFDLASASSKELRFQCDIDSSWKKCSSRTCVFSNGNTVLIPISSGNDLSFTTVFVTVSGAPASVNTGSLYLDYDVEFRDPISYGVNA